MSVLLVGVIGYFVVAIPESLWQVSHRISVETGATTKVLQSSAPVAELVTTTIACWNGWRTVGF